ncbi:hypothetical protein [Saccharolobus shibatae]|uniref:Uncharacterized protein n=1 Tax=Saccharolobus shibatae TaxID=2286 RepID=A0A8F5H0T3_9CREN|nr:hypothetical protein [Saccharolobus shibatae]QXJ36584.1 hypothetical protein J5U22_03161 [Saccharolobus shibatae]
MDEQLKEEIELIEHFEQLFEAIDFSQNRIQQSAQHVEERDIFDVIDRVLSLQKTLEKKNEPQGIEETIRLIVELIRALGDEKVQQLLKDLFSSGAQK